MRFQTRLVLTYSLLIVLLVIGLGIGFFLSTARLLEDIARANANFAIEKIVQQFEGIYRSMDFLETNLISDETFKSSLDTLGSIDRTDPRNSLDVNDATRHLSASILTYSAVKNFYAVDLFNSQGDFFSSNFTDHLKVQDVPTTLAKLPWAASLPTSPGRKLLLPPSVDPWNPNQPRRVFTLVRYMIGSKGDLGYIEVQNDAALLAQVFSVPHPEFTRVVAWTKNHDLFYQSSPLSSDERGWYAPHDGADSPPAPGFVRVAGREELILQKTSTETGLIVVLGLDRTILVEPLWGLAGITAWIGVLILLVSVLYNWYSSRQLTQPLRLIQQRIESTGINNLPTPQPLVHPNDEIVAINNAFEKLKERLDEAIRDEIHSRMFGVRAQFDSLQAQVNPHFLYNILTVLANKGLQTGDPEIGEICEGIASMLRYSTSTADHSTTLERELSHVRTYLDLMKKRFHEDLSYSIDVVPEILQTQLPKIVLQQIVENSINHGFVEVAGPMRLCIRGMLQGQRWVLEFVDNGQGFAVEELEKLEAALSETASRLEAGSGEGLSVGGLGLRNTYGRLFLFFEGQVTWTMDNLPGGGARVTISAPLRMPEASHAL